MAKKVIGSLKLQVKAQQANPSPPVGPALGQRGLNIMAFVKEFNAKSAEFAPGTPVPVVITYYQDKSLTKCKVCVNASGAHPMNTRTPLRTLVAAALAVTTASEIVYNAMTFQVLGARPQVDLVGTLDHVAVDLKKQIA